MIGYRAVLTPGSERYVHHMMLYECHDDRGSSYSRFNHHVNSGYECHAPNMPVDFKVMSEDLETNLKSEDMIVYHPLIDHD